VEQDRSFYFVLENNHVLLFKMHGSRSNLILFEKGQVIEVFKNRMKKDFDIEINSLAKKVDMSKDHFWQIQGDPKKLIPTLGRAFDPWFRKRNYAHLAMEEKYETVRDLIVYLEDPTIYLHEKTGAKPALSLYKLHESDREFSDPIDALNAIFRAYISGYKLYTEKLKLRKQILNRIQKSKNYINNTESKLENLKTGRNYAHIGDLIMANLHAIKPHRAEVTLTDFYTQEPILVQLKPNLSAQLNAEKYYRKSKNQQLELQNLKKNISEKISLIGRLQEQLDKLDEVTKIKDLKKDLPANEKVTEKPYHATNFMGYDILIGKNARKNELLTFSVATKDDMFLHAKDTPGSHVIIRTKINQNIPRAVLEKAASYAAYYSKSANESMVRVLYTPKKYVRKAKGSAPGMVIVSREKAILAKPEQLKK
jgi:predicted ribosome quality control (RQC) complex YloA/Tae2 family protein